MSNKTITDNFKGQVFYLGIDTHKSNWKVNIRTSIAIPI